MPTTAGRARLQRITFGKETTANTAVTPTTTWRGNGGMIEDMTDIQIVPEQSGIYGGFDRSFTSSTWGQLALASCDLTFEQFQYMAVAAFAGPSTGIQDGSGTNYIYTTNIPTNNAISATPLTFQGGDNLKVQQLNGAVCSKFSITGTAKDAAKIDASFMGQQVTTLGTGFAAGAYYPIVEQAVATKSSVYLDAISGAYGTTKISNQVKGWKLDVEAKWEPQFTNDGVLYPAFFLFSDWTIKGSIDFTHDTQSLAEYTNWTGEIPRLLRFDIAGSNVATAGTTYSQKHIIFDLPIKYSKIAPLSNNAGVSMRQLQFSAHYNAVAGNAGKIVTVLDGIATLP